MNATGNAGFSIVNRSAHSPAFREKLHYGKRASLSKS